MAAIRKKLVIVGDGACGKLHNRINFVLKIGTIILCFFFYLF